MEIQPNKIPIYQLRTRPDGKTAVEVDGQEEILFHRGPDAQWEQYDGGMLGEMGLWRDAPQQRRVRRDGILGWLGFKKTVVEPPNGKVEPEEVRALWYQGSEETKGPYRDVPLPSPVEPKAWKALHFKHRFKFHENMELERVDSSIKLQAKKDTDEIVLDFDVYPNKLFVFDHEDQPLSFQRNERGLLIQRALTEGEEFGLNVSFEGQPSAQSHPSLPTDAGWLTGPDRVVTMNGLDFASSWMPTDNDPSNKAPYEFQLEVPDNLMAAANGELVEKQPTEGGTAYIFRSEEMAAYLASVNVFDKEKYTTTKVGDNFEVIHPKGAEERVRKSFARQGEMMELLSEKLGPYPFSTYSAIVTDLPADKERLRFTDGERVFEKQKKYPLAFEAQTRSIFEESGIYGEEAEDTIFHELSHQWFGNSVTKKTPKDIWVAEGVGRYSGRLWAEHKGEGERVEQSLKALHAQLKQHKFTDTMACPDDDKLISQENYGRMELSMHALRKEVGDEQFFASLKHVAQEYKGKSLSSEEMAEVINQYNGGHLSDFFQAWLHSKEIPDIKFD